MELILHGSAWHMTFLGAFLRFLTERVRQRTVRRRGYENEKVNVSHYFETSVLLLLFSTSGFLAELKTVFCFYINKHNCLSGYILLEII